MILRKGTKGIIIAIIMTACLTAILYSTVNMLFSDTYTVRYYSDPVVAKKVIRGTIYDSSGRLLPDGYSTTDIISSTFSSYTVPIPELNKDITYGYDVYLTLDPTLQYSLNSECKNFIESVNPDKLKITIINPLTEEVLATCFFDKSSQQNRFTLNPVNFKDRTYYPKIVKKITSYNIESTEEEVSELNNSLLENEILVDSENSIIIHLSSKEKEYLIAFQTDKESELMIYLQNK